MKKYNREFYEFVRNHIKGTRYYKMVEMVKEKFGIEMSVKAMNSYCKRYGLKNGLFHSSEDTRPHKVTTPEMDEYIREINSMRTAKEVAQMVNEKFGTSFTQEQIKGYRARHKLVSGLTGRFEKGQIPHNKGKKMPPEVYEKVKATMFKKGNRPHNTLPVGTEIADATPEHYIKIKIAEPNVWKYKHQLIWEEHNGPVPEGMNITFLDGNNRNFDISNLAMITNAENSLLTTLKLRKNKSELTAEGINIAKLHLAMKKLKKKKGK